MAIMRQGTGRGTSNGQAPSLRNRLVLGTALATSAFVGGYRGYVRRAHADCIGSIGIYSCSGTTTTTQVLEGAPLTVTTVPDFSIDTTGTGGNAFILNGTGGLTFTDNNLSAITGAASGIGAGNNGSGVLSIIATGTVRGTSSFGIYANNYGTDLTIEAVDVGGGDSGIAARNYGTGVLSITATGAVTGAANLGIYGRNVNGTDLTIDAVDATGVVDAITARNYGSGALSITATGTMTGTVGIGVYARNNEGATELSITAARASGGQLGILGRNYGTGALAITATDTVTGTGLDGIYARNTGTDLTVSAVDVSGGARGIYARNLGTGGLTVTASGTVTGTSGGGIFAQTYGNGLAIQAADVSGGFGIEAYHVGAGALSITASGTVTGTSNAGILAEASGSTTALTIQAANVSGGTDGIHAEHAGTGPLAITASGAVRGTSGGGIFAQTYGSGFAIQAADVSGRFGIEAYHEGAGALSIATTGTVTGTGDAGILAEASSSTTALTIQAANVSGASDAIHVEHAGTGPLAITVTGAVRGNGGTGIYSRNESATAGSTTALTVESGATVSGTTAGVELVSGTGRAASVANAGSIAGATGILANTAGSVTITNAGSITGTGGAAINLIGVNGASTVNQQGGLISGDILLSSSLDQVGVVGGVITGNINGNDGGDVISVSGGSIGGNVIGGNGVDQVTVSAGSIAGGIDAETVTLTGSTIGGDITGLRTVVIDDPLSAAPLDLRDGVVLSGTNAVATIKNTDLSAGGTKAQLFSGFDSVTVDPSTIKFGTGTNSIGLLSLEDGSTLIIDGNAVLTGTARVVGSTIDMLDGAADDVLTLGGLALNNAQIRLDINQQTVQADQFVTGAFSATGVNVIVVNLVGAPSFAGQTDIPIVVSTAGIDPSLFTVQALPGTVESLFFYQLVPGANGGLVLRAIPADFAVALAPQPAVNAGTVGTALDAIEGITSEALRTDLGLAVGSQGVQIQPTVGVFASGQFAHTEHDGFRTSSDTFAGGGPSFGSDEFSAAISIDFNAAKHFNLDKQYGLNLGLFAGYASADVALGSFQGFDRVGDASNRSGMFGGYGLFRQDHDYVLVSATAFLGNTDVFSGVLNTTGEYDTEGYAITGSVGHIFVLGERTRFDLRGGALGVIFSGDDFVDSGGNQFGDSQISFGAIKFEPGIYADFQLENGMVLSPYARADLQQRFSYSNTASLDGREVSFDDADFSAAVSTGFNLKMSDMATMSGEVRGKFSSDSSAIAGKLGLKISF
jgi:hypothetical protein